MACLSYVDINTCRTPHVDVVEDNGGCHRQWGRMSICMTLEPAFFGMPEGSQGIFRRFIPSCSV